MTGVTIVIGLAGLVLVGSGVALGWYAREFVAWIKGQ